MLPIRICRGEFNSGQAFLSARIDGHDIEFLVDTGASSSFIGAHQATDLLPSLGAATKGGASGHIEYGEKIKLHSFELGSRTFSNLLFQRFKSAPIHYLGMDVLRQGSFSFDFPRSLFNWEVATPETPQSYETGPKGHIRLPTSLNTEKLLAIFDTGAGITTVDRDFVKRFNDSFEFIQKIEGGKDINGHLVEMVLYRCHSLIIGNKILENDLALAIDFSSIKKHLGDNAPIILGFNHIAKHCWHFEPNTKLWSLK